MAADGCSVVVSIERASDEAMFICFGCVRNYRDVRIYDTTRARCPPKETTKPPQDHSVPHKPLRIPFFFEFVFVRVMCARRRRRGLKKRRVRCACGGVFVLIQLITCCYAQ